VKELRRWGYIAWLLPIAGFALLHALNLRADFPNGSPWIFDWAKYTDEGWYGNAAIRAHLFGNWYLAGDFNPAVALPAWPFLEWVLFFATGVSAEAARGLAVACFFASLALSYSLLRARGPRWMPLLALTMLVTSPFLYCFSRLAILEPLQTTLTLAALNLALRLPAMRRPRLTSAAIGLLFALAALTKTTEIFLLPAVEWAIVGALWQRRRLAAACAAWTAGCAAAAYGAWLAVIGALGLLGDYRYYFFINTYPKPPGWGWLFASFWWSLHGLLWVDHSLVALAAAFALGAVVARRSAWARRLWREPLFGCSLCAVAGYVVFMTVQNHPQPRYYALPAFFCFFVVALGVSALLREAGMARWAGGAVLAAAVCAAAVHATRTARYALHPEYTLARAAAQLTIYIDAHPNGKRLLLANSGDEVALLTHLPALCDDFGTEDLPAKSAAYGPGWYASWNDLDPETLRDLHVHFSLEQVAAFRAMDHPERNLLVLFKLHSLPGGAARDPGDAAMREPLPDDVIEVPME